jgi:hypothetical protein
MTHPLTDEIIEEIAEDVFYYDYSIPIFRQDMRAAYDLGREEGHVEMLEAVSRWTKKHAWSYMEECQYENDHEFNDSRFLANLKKAMWPTTTQENI